MGTVIDLTFIEDERRRVEVGPDMALVWDGDVPKFDHLCEVMVDGTQKRVAPRLYPGGHQVVSLDPLTVRPSILCGACGLHGFIRDGRWVPA